MARKISVEIVGDSRSLERAFKKSSRSANKFQGDMSKTSSKTKRSFGGLSRGVVGLAGAFVGTAGLVGAARAAFGEMAEAQKVTAQTNAVLKSTGKAAKVSAKQVEGLAESLMTMSGVDDELIQQGENLLLTFNKIRNEVGKGNDIFDQATKATLDYSVATGRDMTQAAIQVGKALQDPIKGVTALGRSGTTFTEQQKDQIKALVESGKQLEAQKLILRELEVQYGGSAKAAGETLPGKLNILRNTLLNLAGNIAAMLTPAITKLVDKIVAWTSKSQNQKKVLDTVRAAASAVESVVRLLAAAFNALNSITGSTKTTFKILLGFFIAFKALKLAAYITKMAGAMKAFAVWSAAANAAGAGGVAGGGKRGGRFGKLGRFAKVAPFLAGRAAGTVGAAYLGAKGLQRLIGQAPNLISPRGAAGGVRSQVVVDLHLDGKKLATATARHNQNAAARRRRQSIVQGKRR